MKVIPLREEPKLRIADSDSANWWQRNTDNQRGDALVFGVCAGRDLLLVFFSCLREFRDPFFALEPFWFGAVVMVVMFCCVTAP